MSRLDFDSTEREISEVWSGPPEPVVEFHTAADAEDLRVDDLRAGSGARPPPPPPPGGGARASAPAATAATGMQLKTSLNCFQTFRP